MPKMKRRRLSQTRRNRPVGRSEVLEPRILLAADWQNPVDVYDVDAAESSVAVTPLDALLVINELNSPSISDPLTGALPTLGPNTVVQPPYVDVDANGYVSPLDALLVINELNAEEPPISDTYTSVFAASDFIAGSHAALSHGDSIEDTLVNTTTARAQRDPDVAADAAGNIVAVWQSFGQENAWDIYGQRYTPDGEKIGGEFLVNTTTHRSQRNPAVAMDSDGSFMVVWQSKGQDGSNWGIYGQLFDSSGAQLGDEVRINDTTHGKQLNPDVAFVEGANSEGDSYVVTWEGRGEGDRNGVFANQFVGGTFTGEKLVNATTSGPQDRPAVAGTSNGEAIIAWQGRGEDGQRGVFMTTLSELGEETQVNLSDNGVQKWPTVAASKDGAVVGWQSQGNVYSRSFMVNAEGGVEEAMSGEIHIAETTTGGQRRPSAAILADGNYVVSWFGNGVGDRRGVFSRTFAMDGEAETDETLNNHTTKCGQIRPATAAVNNGYVTLWQGRGEGDHKGIFARFTDTELDDPFVIDPIDDVTVNEEETVSLTITVTDLSGSIGTPTFSLVSGPNAATVDAMTGEFNWVTTEADGPGVYTVEVSATAEDLVNGESITMMTSFMITVNEVNQAPVLDPIADQTVRAGDAFSLMVTATDADLPAQALTYSATAESGPLPSWLVFDAATQFFSGTPSEADEGTETIIVTVTDELGASDTESFDLTVTVTQNQPPVVDMELVDQTVNEGDSFSYDTSTSFSDPDGDMLTFTATNLPGWAMISTSGVITGTPENGDVGSESVTVIAADPAGASASSTFTLTVVDVNTNAPSALDAAFRIPTTSSNGTVVGTVVAADADPADVLTYSITDGNGDGVFGIDESTGEITVVDDGPLGSLSMAELTVEVSDGLFSDTAEVTIFVTDEPALVAYSLEARDDEGNPVTSLAPGDTFDLVLVVQDIRAADPTGVFSAFTDIVYQDIFVSVAGDVVHSTTYNQTTSAGLDTSGLIDEAGGLDGLSPLGGDPLDVLTVPMMVSDNLVDGTSVSFGTNPTENQEQHPTLLFGGTDELEPSVLEFGTLTVVVSSGAEVAQAASSWGVGETTVLPDISQELSVSDEAVVTPSSLMTPELRPVEVAQESSSRDRTFAEVFSNADDSDWWKNDWLA